eukprot:gnl/Carplike_NY0171/3206_a4313_580.p1 GENE.gnl/Carplike_NY0171/3206_a4313_580~~gnl/Carplike_NY0171/3206_a4313_580.p1  ORF type:complete len:182 (+),score=27.37 gnl/Carplike_NY0171/3206_a4313_580:86-631(+)
MFSIDSYPSIEGKLIHEREEGYFPLEFDDISILSVDFMNVKGLNLILAEDDKGFDQDKKAKSMLKNLPQVGKFTFVSIPFLEISSIMGVYICVSLSFRSTLLLFTFSKSDGTKICKKYVFSKIKHCHTWFYLPVDLSNIILCEIEGAGTTFQMDTVFFVREESPEDEVKRRIKEKKKKKNQ